MSIINKHKKSWDIWIQYCKKLDKWYSANPDKVEEFEPTLMTPPFDAIVKSNLYAAHQIELLDKLLEAVKRNVENPSLNTSRELVIVYREYQAFIEEDKNDSTN